MEDLGGSAYGQHLARGQVGALQICSAKRGGVTEGWERRPTTTQAGGRGRGRRQQQGGRSE